MITFKTGNILLAEAEALVNTVNTVGVMGKGIALQFKEAFPDNFKLYKQAFEKGDLIIGKMFVFRTNRIDGVQYIINFPTKKEWFRPSSYDWIEQGLTDLVNVIKQHQINSIALPPLGCGNGRLDWQKVKPLILKYLEPIENLHVIIYEPDSEVEKILKSQETKKAIGLTPVRAMLLYTLFHYEALGEEASLFAANKLSYFLQRFGETQMKLNFIRHHYGPYSNQVDHLMHAMNGKYILGLGQMEAKAFEPLKLNYKYFEEVKTYFDTQLGIEERSHVLKLIQFVEGFESSLALELLSSVDSHLQENPRLKPSDLYTKLQSWSARKRKLFEEWHVQVAYEHLVRFRENLFPEMA